MHSLSEGEGDQPAGHAGGEDGDPAETVLTCACGLGGPLPMSRAGHRYLLTAIDRSTRWFEAVLLADISAETVLEAFISCWVACFGVPKQVTSDRGAQFTSGT